MTHNSMQIFPAFSSDASRARYMAAYEEGVKEWPVPYEELDIPTEGGSTHVIVSGARGAPALVLLSSFAASATVWRLNVADFSRNFRVFAIDVIGQPGKSTTTLRLTDRGQYAKWLSDLFDALEISSLSLVGCSFGGFLAINYALEAPERVDCLVLISPVGTFASQYWKLFFAMRIRAPLHKLMRRLTRNHRPPSLNDLRKRPIAAMPRDPKWAQQMAVTMTERPTVTVINPAVFTKAQLRAIRAPTLLLIGELETLYEPRAALEKAQNLMPHLRGAIVPNADHIAAMAEPEDVDGRIIDFVRAIRSDVT